MSGKNTRIMFKYISEILAKFTPAQRILALVLLLLSITLITLVPKVVESLTYDNDELTLKVERQKKEIKDLSDRVTTLNETVLKNQEECTNTILSKEREILQVIDEIEKDAAALHTKTIRTTSRVETTYPRYVEETNDSLPRVSAMVIPDRRVHSTTTQIDNGKVLKNIRSLKEKIHKDLGK